MPITFSILSARMIADFPFDECLSQVVAPGCRRTLFADFAPWYELLFFPVFAREPNQRTNEAP